MCISSNKSEKYTVSSIIPFQKRKNAQFIKSPFLSPEKENKPVQNIKEVLQSIRITKKQNKPKKSKLKVSKKLINISRMCSCTADKIAVTDWTSNNVK